MLTKSKFITLILFLIFILVLALFYLMSKGLFKFSIILSIVYLIFIGMVMRDNIDRIV